jgi:hypothetical protein
MKHSRRSMQTVTIVQKQGISSHVNKLSPPDEQCKVLIPMIMKHSRRKRLVENPKKTTNSISNEQPSPMR